MEPLSQQYGFTSAGRQIVDEDEINLTSVGVDIGSSTSHLVFSRLKMKRLNTRYVIAERSILYASEILLTPYLEELTIDANTLSNFINRQYEIAGIRREDVDTGALILTGVAVLRKNARAVAELFAEEAGRLVAVSAGDSLESTMAAYGSGAVAYSSKTGSVCLNIDIGGGTSKIAICADGKVLEVTAIDVGARLLVLNEAGAIIRIEKTGRLFAEALGINLELNRKIGEDTLQAIAAKMADRLFEVVSQNSLSPEAQKLLRLPPLNYQGKIDAITFSGGVAEFVYRRESQNFGDLGLYLADEIKSRLNQLGTISELPTAGIRATVVGASQYTIQLSGSTIFVSPITAIPVRNIPVAAPDFSLEDDQIDRAAIAQTLRLALVRLDLLEALTPFAIGLRWNGSVTFARLQAFCEGLIDVLKKNLANGHPIVLVSDSDIGGLLGLHLKEEMGIGNPVISIDGIELREFDYIDIGELIASSGSVPVVIKSLIFPALG
ncbi:ethanolamine ammonia-lyase reactivating factor EutA [Thermodesulfobacteriota bacterium]